jgi:hypothetical protein
MSFFSPNEIIASLQLDSGYDTEKFKTDFRRWVYIAMAEIGGGYTYIKHSAVLKLDNNLTVQTPVDLLRLSHAYLIDTEGNSHEPYYADTIDCAHIEKCHIRDETLTISQSEDKRYFQFSSQARKFVGVKLKYYFHPYEDDLPMIPLFAYDAIALYVDYMNKKMTRSKYQQMGASRNNPVLHSEVMDFRRLWLVSRQDATAKLCSPGFATLMQIGVENVYADRAYPVRSDVLVQSYRSFIGKD